MNAGTLTFADISELEAALAAMAEVTCETEGLSELDHALQCAEEARLRAPADEGLQIAALLHDIGHRFGPAHDVVGAAALRPLFGERIAGLVGLHVLAKRYLVATDPAYAENLSVVSVETLGLQGGAMSAAEVLAFEQQPHWRDALALRCADEAAKQVDRSVASLEAWLPILHRCASASSQGSIHSSSS